jgi:phage-related protein (TIGR01555 family)
MAEIRNDGYINAVLGHGMKSRDPFSLGRYGGGANNWLLDYREADNMFSFNGLARRVISLPAEEALRNGFEIKAGGEDIDEATHRRLCSMLEDLNVNKTMINALEWDRLYGGGAVLMLADDGGTLEDPLNLSRVRRIERLEVYAPEDISFTNAMLYVDPLDPNYGKPQFYNIIGLWGNSFLVHESRLLLFHGGDISNYYRRMRQGWGATVFEQVKDALLHYSGGQDLAFMALARLSQGVLKLANMNDLLMNDQGEMAVQKRLHLIDMARHMMNTIAIDTEDDYDQKSMNLTNVDKVLDEFQVAICSATGIPATMLFGKSPAGMNATGESDLENYYNLVEEIQQHTLRHPLSRLIDVVANCSEYGIRLPEEWYIRFNSLWNESEKEEAEVKRTKAEAKRAKAEAINTLVQTQILDVSEARATLAKGDDYVIDRSLDSVLTEPIE